MAGERSTRGAVAGECGVLARMFTPVRPCEPSASFTGPRLQPSTVGPPCPS